MKGSTPSTAWYQFLTSSYCDVRRTISLNRTDGRSRGAERNSSALIILDIEPPPSLLTPRCDCVVVRVDHVDRVGGMSCGLGRGPADIAVTRNSCRQCREPRRRDGLGCCAPVRRPAGPRGPGP